MIKCRPSEQRTTTSTAKPVRVPEEASVNSPCSFPVKFSTCVHRPTSQHINIIMPVQRAKHVRSAKRLPYTRRTLLEDPKTRVNEQRDLRLPRSVIREILQVYIDSLRYTPVIKCMDYRVIHKAGESFSRVSNHHLTRVKTS